MQMQDNYILWWQLSLIEFPAKVHYLTRSKTMLEYDIEIIQRCANVARQANAFFSPSAMHLLENLRNRLELLELNDK